ncbi:MAG TPA: hypothetical protein VGU43_04115, partial [Thermoplasmata archaeon]|nr:hypothetical protein [Thermoplasmata archaeon]
RYGSTELLLSGVSLALAVGGIAVAYSLWGNGKVVTVAPSSSTGPIRRLLLRRYYFKDAYDAIGLRGMYALSRAADFVEQYVIDGSVHGLERAFAGLSDRLRKIESGIVLDYAAFLVAGLLFLLLLLLVIAPWVLSTGGF